MAILSETIPFLQEKVIINKLHKKTFQGLEKRTFSETKALSSSFEKPWLSSVARELGETLSPICISIFFFHKSPIYLHSYLPGVLWQAF